jgi:hypothetical protein
MLSFFRRHQNLVGEEVWEQVARLKKDWDVTNQTAANALLVLCWKDERVKQKIEDSHVYRNVFFLFLFFEVF